SRSTTTASISLGHGTSDAASMRACAASTASAGSAANIAPTRTPKTRLDQARPSPLPAAEGRANRPIARLATTGTKRAAPEGQIACAPSAPAPKIPAACAGSTDSPDVAPKTIDHVETYPRASQATSAHDAMASVAHASPAGPAYAPGWDSPPI